MDDLPFNVPVLLRSYYELDLQNLHGMDVVKCIKTARGEDEYASVVLHRVDKDSVAIQAYRNKRFLSVNDSGDYRFASPPVLTGGNKFIVETRVISSTSNHLFFVSRNTGKTLQCSSCGSVCCENFNHNYREAWAIVELASAASLAVTESSLKTPESRITEANERRGWILELVKAGKSPKEVEELVALMYPPSSTLSATSAAK